MEPKLLLDRESIQACHDAARAIAEQVSREIAGKSTLSVERTIARLLGVDGVDDDDVPLPNRLVDQLLRRGKVASGLAYWLGNAMVQTGLSAQAIAEKVARDEIDLCAVEVASADDVRRHMRARARESWAALLEKRAARTSMRQELGESRGTLAYVLTATGNVYEDVTHARAVANAGGDIVAVIRSTAQSLLDYVPHGPTTEGYGGTFATQANFRIMRQALDEWSMENGRYVRLSSFCSGLCMPEIAAMGALEGLDNMVNDALYGILYRDINMVRTFIDQRVSRMINGAVGAVINTGEDNYLRTADAVAAAPSVVASQMINYYLAKESRLPDSQIAIGNSFEIDPTVENGLLYEWAQAQLTRELFPDCPVKFMPPTKHMNGNLFRTHACDTLFNLVTIATQQGIQTIGVPTEGIHTPHIQDRVVGLENVHYVFNFARNLGDEIEFRRGGIIQKRASSVLDSATDMLAHIRDMGLFQAIEAGMFGDVKRSPSAGKGREGIFEVSPHYFNPFEEIMVSA